MGITINDDSCMELGSSPLQCGAQVDLPAAVAVQHKLEVKAGSQHSFQLHPLEVDEPYLGPLQLGASQCLR